MTGKRLRVLTRSEPSASGDDSDQNWNLFARLSPKTARDLSESVEYPEFLPLCLSSSSLKDPIYVSFNGGSIHEDDCIQLAAGTLPEHVTHVTVSSCGGDDVSDALSVQVEPLSTSDWEAIEVYTDFLEQGGLLEQVSVVYPRQVLRLRLCSEIVQVKVLKASAQGSPCCFRLLADTEVHVAPKPRQSTGHGQRRSPLLRVMPAWEDYTPAMQQFLAGEMTVGGEPFWSPPKIHVEPCTVLVHPSTLKECGFVESGSLVMLRKERRRNPSKSEATYAVARVQSSDLEEKNSIVLHKLLRYQLDLSPLFDCIRLDAFRSMDSSLAFDMVTAGSLSFSLEQVQSIECAADNEHPSLYPGDERPKMLWSNTSESAGDESYMARLRPILASWLDLSDADKELPFCPGSLIAVPWQHSAEQAEKVERQIYRLVAHSELEDQQETDMSNSAVCVLAKDLPELLLKSSASGCQEVEARCVATRIVTSRRELSLNLLPPTPNVVAESWCEATSNLARRDLECFDSIFVVGELGSGKTHTALLLAAQARVSANYATLYLDCKKLQSSSDARMKDVLRTLTELFREADEARPCVVVLDDADDLIPNMYLGNGEEDGSTHQQQANPVAVDQTKLISDHVLNLIQNVATSHTPREKIFVVLTCQDEQSVHPEVVSQTFHRFVQVPVLNTTDRKQVLAAMLHGSIGGELPTTIHFETLLHETSIRAEGFRARDLGVVVTRALHMVRRSDTKKTDIAQDVLEALDIALNGYTPISRQGIREEDVSSLVEWSQVGGLFRAKESLSSSILRPVRYRRIYQLSPIRLPRGILLFGFPGCGKSYLVPSLAKEGGLTLITCRGPELLDKYIGASEVKVRQLFQRAYTAAPSLLFLDEFDALAPVRGSDNTGVTDRVVNQLLTYLDGVEDAATGSVYIVAATSRPDKIDPALLRPGRLERHIFVGFPASEEEWHSVLEQALAGHEIGLDLQDALRKRRLWETEGTAHVATFSPSDIKAVVDTAYLNAVHEYLNHSNEVSEEREACIVSIQRHHMVNALQSTRPSLSIDDRRMLNLIYRPFLSAAERNDEEPGAANEPRRLMTALR